MFSDILEQMEAVELDPSELEQPISLNLNGGIATIRDLIAERAPARVQSAFGRYTDLPPPTAHVRPVRDLDRDMLKHITVVVLQQSDPHKRLAAMGRGTFSSEDLIREVQIGSDLGNQICDAVRLNGLFLEAAVTEGKIKPKLNDPRHTLPDFDF